MRFLLAILAVLLAILICQDARSQGNTPVRERVWLSRTCTDSKWYLVESDDQSVTMSCDMPNE